MEQAIRWQQRFANFVKALHKLTEAVEYIDITSRKETSLLMTVKGDMFWMKLSRRG